MELSLLILGTLSSFIGALYIFLSRRAKISIESQLSQIDGGSVAVIRALKIGQKRLVIKSIRFSIHIWDNSPRLVVSGLDKARRVTQEIFSPTFHYVSDDVVKYSSDNKKMEEGDDLYAYIDIDKMMESYILSRESLGSKSFFNLMLWMLNVEVVCTNGKIYRCQAHRDIKLYLKSKYMDDYRLYGTQT